MTHDPARYTGRGLGWAKKLITKRKARRVARWYAGAMINHALEEEFRPEYLIKMYGEEGFNMIKKDMGWFGDWLMATGESPWDDRP